MPTGDDLETELLLLELALARRDGAAVDGELADLIDADAREFGSSGRRWDRAGIVGLLDVGQDGADVVITDGSAEELGAGVVLVTYTISVTAPGGPVRRSLRSSIWVRRPGGWRLRFHQGTVMPAPTPDATA